ncbi:ROK family protein [Chitinophagaceae bacterium LB-8]|uniref:ROK family protein n=1 Tax=Paraflavisolibacter caeni TaxID=2982496 RepID=A0A9X2XUC8_9BACT|nr:ROK family protein [Paraflavisolibacter caeni]MCU7548740.1 ROK family protein [Paraflavisolibacter caeni]
MPDKTLLYKKKIIKHLYFNSVLSCTELSGRIKKSLPVTTKILNDLIEEGQVIEKGHAPSTGGRRPATYSLNPGLLYIVAVAMDQFVTRIAILNTLNNEVEREKRFELPLPGNKDALSDLTVMIAQVIDQSGIPKDKIAGIGIGMPGFVDVRKGVNYSFLQAPGSSITSYISNAVNLPVFIDNDSSLIALAELRFGAARERSNAMVINLGWGIGLGMVLNGELFRGHNGFAGEFSHIPIFSNGKLCSCGKRGCLETEASMLVVIQKAIEGLKQGRLSRLKPSLLEHFEQASESIIAAAREGDQYAIELFSEAGYNIGRGVAILIHLMNPEVVVLSGRGAGAGKIWLAPIQQALNEHCIPRLADNTSIEFSTLGYRAELIGAASLVMDYFEKEPFEQKRLMEQQSI